MEFAVPERRKQHVREVLEGGGTVRRFGHTRLRKRRGGSSYIDRTTTAGTISFIDPSGPGVKENIC